MKCWRVLLLVCLGVTGVVQTAPAEPPHRWRSPFGLDRVGTQPVDQGIEADAIAHAEPRINPVDLGTILVPEDWLLITRGQTARIALAAIAHGRAESGTRLKAWFASAPESIASQAIDLPAGKRVEVGVALAKIPEQLLRDKLQVQLSRTDGTVLWEKSIDVMLVQNPPKLPKFGAIATKLRYDLPISVRHEDGSFSSLEYDQGWEAKFDDVVVCLPGGQRFVFWRGSSYIPFWAGVRNTGLSYEWAETKPPADGFKDCVEPLMDKELRYSRVEILESSAARIHVRWTYQSCDFNYKVWGDLAVEDYYFYPDGFGTRVLTLQSALDSEYELSEFIIITPPGAYPFQVLGQSLVKIVFLDGQSRTIDFPYDPAEQPGKLDSRKLQALYRVQLHQHDPATAIYFHPTERELPPVVFRAFIDQGQVVTPCYWGSHWPLGRGQTTGGAIDNRLHLTPSHNSLMSWASQQPQPLREAQLQTIDTLGRSKLMRRQTWAWLIGQSEEADESLLERARSFAAPPSLQVRGARLGAESYALDRRAIGLVAESATITVECDPTEPVVNPVFEIARAPGVLSQVRINGRAVPATGFAWDGATLWLQGRLVGRTQLVFEFSPEGPRP